MVQRFVQFLRFCGNCGPTKVFFRAFPAGLAKSFAQLRIFHQSIDPRREISRELFGICRLKWALLHLFEWNQESGVAIYNDLFDAAHGACHNGSLASHRFKVDDAEWFVD
jgi:hypothetical protein